MRGDPDKFASVNKEHRVAQQTLLRHKKGEFRIAAKE
jgi:hypothetical protein